MNIMMKKLAAVGSVIISFLTPIQALAQDTINVTAPSQGFKNLGNAITNALTIAFGIAVLLVLVYLVWGAFDWITSGGDKDAVAKARNKIINALIGLAVLAIAFALAKVAAQFLGFSITNISVPTPDQSPTGL